MIHRLEIKGRPSPRLCKNKRAKDL